MQQAYMISTIDFFWLLGWGFFGLIVLIWFARLPFNKARPTPAEYGAGSAQREHILMRQASVLSAIGFCWLSGWVSSA